MNNDQIEEEKRGDADVSIQPVLTENRRNEGEESKMHEADDDTINQQRDNHNGSDDIDELLEDQLGQENFTQMTAGKLKIFKVIIVIIFIIVFTMVNLFPNMSLFKIECLFDYTHDYTSPVNEWMKDNKGAKNALLIIGGLMSDFIVLTCLGLWTYKGKTWRLPLALVFIYCAKAVLSGLFKYRYPEGYLWENPGFYSLTTPYGSSNDMHFTLHVCLLYVIFHELRTVKLYVLASIAFFVFMYQFTMALCTRGAYIIDLFAAFIFGHFFFVVAEQLSYYIDVKIFGLTFQERFPHFRTECGKCKHPINQWTKNSVEDVQRAMKEHALEQEQNRRAEQ